MKKFDDDAKRHESQKSALLRLELVSKREKEVMALLAAGRPLKKLAEELSISVQTASKHQVILFRKLEVTNEVEMLKFLMAVNSSYGDDAQNAA